PPPSRPSAKWGTAPLSTRRWPTPSPAAASSCAPTRCCAWASECRCQESSGPSRRGGARTATPPPLALAPPPPPPTPPPRAPPPRARGPTPPPALPPPLARLVARAGRAGQMFVTTHSREVAAEIGRLTGARTIELSLVGGESRISGQRLAEEEEEDEEGGEA